MLGAESSAYERMGLVLPAVESDSVLGLVLFRCQNMKWGGINAYDVQREGLSGAKLKLYYLLVPVDVE